MRALIIVVLSILLIYLIDTFSTYAYCKFQVYKDKKFGERTSDKPQYTQKQVNAYRFPKKQVKWFFYIYRGWIRYKLHLLGTVPCHAYRNFILRNVYLMKLSKTAVLYGGFEIRAPWKIVVGRGTIIGDECKLDGRNGIEIGENVNLSTGVWIWTEQHDLNDPDFASNKKGGKVTIGDRAWLSSRTVVLPGVSVAKGCVLAAGAVATKDVQPVFSVWGGVPAKMIGERNKNLRYTFSGSHEAFR